MGQKIHPHGLRIAINRKWNQSWFAKGSEWKDLFFHQKQVESFFKSFFYLYPYTKQSTTKQVLIVDLKLFKYDARQLFIFLFFYKLRTKRRSTQKLTSKIKINKQITKKNKFKNTFSIHKLIFKNIYNKSFFF